VIGSNVNNARIAQAHLSLLWRPTDSLSITPSVIVQGSSHDDLPIFISTLPPLQQDNVIAQPGHDNFALPSVTAKYDYDRATVTGAISYFTRHSDQDWDYSTLSPSLITGIAGHAQAIAPGFTNYVARASQDYTQDVWTAEIHIASKPGSAFQWLVGGFYSHQQMVSDFPLYEPQFWDLATSYLGETLATEIFGKPVLLPGDLSFYTHEIQRESEAAGFGEASYQFGGLKLIAGLRFHMLHSAMTRSMRVPSIVVSTVTLGAPNRRRPSRPRRGFPTTSRKTR